MTLNQVGPQNAVAEESESCELRIRAVTLRSGGAFFRKNDVAHRPLSRLAVCVLYCCASCVRVCVRLDRHWPHYISINQVDFSQDMDWWEQA